MKNQNNLQPKNKQKKRYRRFDLLDEYSDSIETLEEMKSWLQEFWTNCTPWCADDDDEMTEEEHQEWMDEISRADEDTLFDMLGGIGYSFDHLEDEQK